MREIRSMWAKTHQSFYSCNQIFRSQTQTNRSLADRFVCVILKFQERNANFSVLELFHFGTCRSWFVKYYIISSIFRCAFSHILSIHRIFEVCICFSRIDGIFVSIYDNREFQWSFYMTENTGVHRLVRENLWKPLWKRFTACSNRQDTHYNHKIIKCATWEKSGRPFIMHIVRLMRNLRVSRYGCCLRIVRGRIRPNRSRCAGMFSI